MRIEYEYGFKPTQKVGDRCVRSNDLYVCIKVVKVLFFYITVLERGFFMEDEF